MVLPARRTIPYQLNKHSRTEGQKQAWGIRDRFQGADLYAPYLASPVEQRGMFGWEAITAAPEVKTQILRHSG